MRKYRSKGFTLVELIIAITILGLLAVGLLAALDPTEQFNKGRDTSTSQIAQTISAGIERYRAARTDNGLPGTFPAGAYNTNSVVLSSTNTIVTSLVTAGELKANFVNSAGAELAKIAIMRNNSATGSIYVCYKPTSKAFQMQGGQYHLATQTTAIAGANVNALNSAVTTQRPILYGLAGYTLSAVPAALNTAATSCSNAASSPVSRDYCVFCYEQ